MKSATLLPCVFLTFVLIIVSVTSASDRSVVQFPFSDQARAAPEDELQLNCKGSEDLCLVEACLGSECSTRGKGIGFSQLPFGEILGKDSMRVSNKDSCQTGGEKEEINNFNFRARSEEFDELDSNNNLGKPSQIPAAHWDHSGSNILMGLDLGMIKKICNIDVLLNDNAEIENGFSVTVSNDSRTLHKAVDESTTETLPNSWSSYDFDRLAGRFIHLTIPSVSEFYVGDDDDDDDDDNDEEPIVSEIKVTALPLIHDSRNSSAQSISTGNITTSNNTTSQLELSPLEFLDAGSDLLNTPMLAPEHYRINQSSLTDMSSTPASNIYTGDIFLP
jgi:hypothetical protein